MTRNVYAFAKDEATALTFENARWIGVFTDGMALVATEEGMELPANQDDFEILYEASEDVQAYWIPRVKRAEAVPGDIFMVAVGSELPQPIKAATYTQSGTWLLHCASSAEVYVPGLQILSEKVLVKSIEPALAK